MSKNEIALKMSELIQEKDKLEVKKSIVAKEYNDQIKSLDSQISDLAHKYLNNDDSPELFEEADSEVIEDESHLLNPFEVEEFNSYQLPEAGNGNEYQK